MFVVSALLGVEAHLFGETNKGFALSFYYNTPTKPCGTIITKLMSEFKKGLSSFFGKVSKAAIDATNKVKDTYNEKEEASKRVAKVSLLPNSNKEESIIAEMNVQYGTGLIKGADTKLVLTTTSIMINGSSSLLKKTATSLIKLSDIKEIHKAKNPVSKVVSYTIVTTKGEHTFAILKKPYKFIQNLSKIVKIEGNLYSIDLLPNETILGIYDGAVKSNLLSTDGTLYLTDKRIIFAKIPKLDGSGEGSEIVYNLSRDQIQIRENKSIASCDYSFTSSDAEFVFKFSGLVPQAFLDLVPGAEGNKDILERRKKAGKVLKVAAMVAAVAGVGGVAEGAEMDDDMDDMEEDGFDDMDTEEVDLDGDGDVDAVGYDTDGDGQIDTVEVDADGDGQIDTSMSDTDGDGQIDDVSSETDSNSEETGGESVEETPEKTVGNLQSEKVKLERKLMGTADPMEREALSRELDSVNRELEIQTDAMFDNMAGRR